MANGDKQGPGCGCPVGCFMVPLLLSILPFALANKLISTGAAAARLHRLGLDFSEPSGFLGFPWNSPIADIVARLGPPVSEQNENGVVDLRYYPKRSVFGGGIRSDIYTFFGGRLIGGECIAIGTPRDRYARAYREAAAAITQHCQSYAIPAGSGTPQTSQSDLSVWEAPVIKSRIMLHRHDVPSGESLLAITISELRRDNEMRLLSRFVDVQPHS